MTHHITNTRHYYLDYLRIAAMIAVVIMHVADRCSKMFTPQDVRWQLCHGFISACRWGVPMFVMISGTLFLGRKHPIDIPNLFKKNILRLSVAYLFWSYIYTLFFSTIPYYDDLFSPQALWNSFAGTLMCGSPHLWFIPLLLGLYVATPILKHCVDTMSKNLFTYWLRFNFFIGILIPAIRAIPSIEHLVGFPISNFSLSFFGGYVFYFLWGYYLSIADLNTKQRKTLYILGVVGAFIAIVGTAIPSYYAQTTIGHARENLTPNIMLLSSALFVWFKYDMSNIQPHAKLYTLIAWMSPHIFGIYLIHIFFLDCLCHNILIWLTQHIDVYLVIPIMVLFTFGFSLLSSIALKKLKPISNYIL